MKKLGAQQLVWLLLATLVLVAVTRASTAGNGEPLRSLSAAERQEVGGTAALMEPTWRVGSRLHFPGDAWSQDDDFQASERAWVHREAERRGVSPRDIFRAIDEHLHAHPPSPPRKATASPCKPRAFYD